MEAYSDNDDKSENDNSDDEEDSFDDTAPNVSERLREDRLRSQGKLFRYFPIKISTSFLRNFIDILPICNFLKWIVSQNYNPWSRNWRYFEVHERSSSTLISYTKEEYQSETYLFFLYEIMFL